MNKIKILLVEDDPNLGFVIKDNLTDKGYEVTHCTNGLDAERMIYKLKFDMYLLDVMMPKKDGFTLAKEIREKKDETPIIFLTAREMQEDKLKGFTVGGDDYITKPFNFDELIMRNRTYNDLERAADIPSGCLSQTKQDCQQSNVHAGAVMETGEHAGREGATNGSR